MAERRILYEYPHHGSKTFGAYDERHISNIQKGIIGELITFDYFHTKLTQIFGRIPWANRWEVVKDRLCLQNHVGCFDEGSDLTIREKTIDVKTYHDRMLVKRQMLNYNLLVNVKEVQDKTPADFYIQAFFTPDNTIILTGCHQGLPEYIKTNIPEDAYACLIRNLDPLTILEELLLET